jgi:hypothetical protein
VNSEAFAELDSSGICRACRNADDAQLSPERLLDDQTNLASILSPYVNSGSGDYDALVMTSGGKDSAYLLWELNRRFPKLRLLAFTIDNGFMSPVALDNAVQNVTKLGIDYILCRPATSVFAKGFRYAITHLEANKGCLQTVDKIDGTIGFDLSKQFACRNRIPLILFGFNKAQMITFFGVDGYELPPERVFSKTTHLLGRRLSEIYDSEEVRHFWDPCRCQNENGVIPRLIAPLCLLDYNEEAVRAKVTELRLIEKGNDSALVTNNAIVQMMVILDYLRLGYADFEPECADMVRAGRADRLYWLHVFQMLEYSAKTGWMVEKDLDAIAARLGIDRAELGLAR